MKFGVFIYNTDDGADPLEVARAAEDLGFESFFCPDHTHIPVSRITPFPMPPWELPREYFRLCDPFVTLAAVAATTTTLKIGTSVCLLVERDPISTAKVTATLDLRSGGRLLFGVGAGWNREEMLNHGTDPRTRMALLEERVGAVRKIWTEDEAEFHGRFVNFDPIYSWPKPLQKPHPPIIIGGGGPGVLDRVVRFGDGWIPGHQKDLGELHARMQELQEKAAAAGRGRMPVTIMFGAPEFYERYLEMGADRVVTGLPAGPTGKAIAELKRLARINTEYASRAA